MKPTDLTSKVLAFATHLPSEHEPTQTIHEAGAWAEFVVGAPGAPAPEVAACERAAADRHYADREESFARCDTDGFLSQWASDRLGDEARKREHIARHGGMDKFPGLFIAATGERVRAKMTATRFGSAWALCDASGKFTGEFFSDNRGTRGALAKHGLVVCGEWAPAEAFLNGHGTGLSGSCWADTRRTDLGFPPGAVAFAKEAAHG